MAKYKNIGINRTYGSADLLGGVRNEDVKWGLSAPDGTNFGVVSYGAYKAAKDFKLDSYTPANEKEQKILDKFRNHKSYTLEIASPLLGHPGLAGIVSMETPKAPRLKDIKVNYDVYVSTINGKLDSYQPKNEEEKSSIEAIKKGFRISVPLPNGQKSDGVSYDMYSSFVNNKFLEYKPKDYIEAKVLDEYKNSFEVPLSVEKDGKVKSFGSLRYSVWEALSNGTITPKSENGKINYLVPTSLNLTKNEQKVIGGYFKYWEEEAKKEREPDGVWETITNTAGYTVENLLAGAVQGLEDASDWTFGTLFQLIPSSSAIEAGEAILTDKDGEDLGTKWKNSIEQRYEVHDWVRENVGTATFALGQTVPALAIEYFTAGSAPNGELLAARLATGGLGNATRLSTAQKVLSNLAKPRASELYTFASAAGGATKAAYRESGDIDASIQYGVLNGLGEIATERLFGGIAGTGIGPDEVFDVSKIKGLKKIANTKIGNKALDIAFEGVEEAIMSAADPFFQKITYNPKAEYSWDTVKDMGESAFQGMLLSSLANASTFTISKGANATQRVKAVKILNANTNAINSILKDGTEKFSPLKYTASVEQIQQRQQEVRMFSEGYADIAIFDAIKNNPKLQNKFDSNDINKVLEKYNFKATEISVGDKFVDDATDNTFTVVERDDTNTTVLIDTPKGAVRRVLNNKQFNNSISIGQIHRIAVGNVNASNLTSSEATPSVETTSGTTVNAEDASTFGGTTATETTHDVKSKIVVDEVAKEVYNTITEEKLSSKQVDIILKSQPMREAFTRLTGVILKGSKAEQKAAIREWHNNSENIENLKLKNAGLNNAHAKVNKLLAKPNVAKIRQILSSESLTKAFEELTGVKLEGDMDAKIATIREYAELARQKFAETMGNGNALTTESTTSTEAENDIVAEETDEDGKEIAIHKDEPTEAEIKTVVDAMNETFKEGAEEKIYEGIENVNKENNTSYEKSLERFAESLISLYNRVGSIGHIADCFTDNGKKVIDAIEGKTDTTTTEDTSKVETDEFHSPGDLAEESVEASATEKSSASAKKESNTESKSSEVVSENTNAPRGRLVTHNPVDTTETEKSSATEKVVDSKKETTTEAKTQSVAEETKADDTQLPEALKRDESGKIRFEQMDIDYSNNSTRKGQFNTINTGWKSQTVDGFICGKYGVHKSDITGKYAVTLLQSGMTVNSFDKVTEAKKVATYLNANLSFNDVSYNKMLSGSYAVERTDEFQSYLSEVKKILDNKEYDKSESVAAEIKDGKVPFKTKAGLVEYVKSHIGDKVKATFNNGNSEVRTLHAISNTSLRTKRPDGSVVTSELKGIEYNDNGIHIDFKNGVEVTFDFVNVDEVSEEVLKNKPESDALKEKKQQKTSKSNDVKLTAERVDGIIREKRKDVANSIVDGEKYSVTDYWHTDLNKDELKLVTEWVRKAGKRESTRITDTANWYKGRLNGKDLFVIYSTESVDNPTILYESSGDDARLELELLIRAVEVLESETSAVEKQRVIDAIFKGNWLQEKRDMENNNAGLGVGGIDTGYASVLQGKSPEFIGSQAFRNVIKNLFGIQEEINSEAWSMPITDSMKDSVLYEGQAIYSTEEGEVNNNEQARNDLLSGNSRRRSDESTRKQAERISSFEQKNQGRDAEERQSFAEELLKQGQAEEVIEGKNKYTLVKTEAYNDDMLAMVEDAKSKGIELGFFLGNARIKFDTKDEFSVNGISKKGGTKLLVRYDGYTAPQKILKHETVHSKWSTDEIQSIKETILNDLTEADKKNILSKSRYSYYKTLYKGDMDAVWEEFVADVMSGINQYIDKYIDVISDYWYGNESAEGYSPSTYAESIDAGGVDADYLKAVESGDTESASKMVEDAAEKAFPNSKVRSSDGKLRLVYHGTVNDFTVFDRQFANIEGDFGKGYYFTSNEYDVDENYANEEGPDLKNKIARMAEKLEYEDEYSDLSYEEREEIARQRFITSEPNTITAYLNMENPVYITPDKKGTFLDFTEEYSKEYDEYGEPEGLLVDFIEALKNNSYDYAYNDVDFSFLYEYVYDGGMYASDAVKVIKERIVDELSDENGDLAISEVIRLAFEEIGFDGIIDTSVYYKFRNMNGMDSGTTHYIVFDSNQIKSADTVTYDDNGKVIPLSERFNPENNDIRYALDTDGLLDIEDVWNEAIKKYGTIPKGEKPARDVKVPRKINEDKVVSQHARTLMEAGITPEEYVSEFEKAILNGDMTHEVVHNKDAHRNGMEKIKELGFKGALQHWDNIMRTNSKVDEDTYAMGVELYRQCVTNKDVKTAMKLASELAVVETHAGRMLQLARLVKTLSPDGQLYYLEKSVAKMEEEFKDKLGNKFKGIKIDEGLMEEFLTEKDEEKRNAVYDKICQNIADQMPVTFREKWDSWRYLAMLGNPKTQIKNLSGNLSFAGAVRIKNYIAATIESGLEKAKVMDSSERSKSFRKNAKAVEFAKEDVNKKEVEVMLQGINAKYTTAGDIQDKRRIFKNKVIEGWRKATFNGIENPRAKKVLGWYGLEKADMKFLKFHYKDALARLITARNIDINSLNKNQLDKLRRLAVKEAQIATFRDANVIAEFLSAGIKSLRDSKSIPKKVLGFIAEGISPFVKTPMNIAKQGYYYSPAGVVTSVVDVVRKRMGADITTAEIVDSFSKNITGTLAMGVGYILTSLGILVGGEDEDEKKSRFDKLAGEQSYAIKIGGRSFTIDWMVPSSMSLFVGSELYNLTQDDFSAADTLNALSRLTEPLLELSVFSGWNNAIEAANYNDSSPIESVIYNAMSSYVTQALPTIGGQISRIIDKNKRSYYYMDKSSDVPVIFQRLIGQVASKIPGASYLYAPTVDDWGRDEEYGGMLERVLENTASPGYYSKTKYTEVDKELKRLYEATGNNEVLPSSQSKKFKEDGKDKYLSAEEFADVKRVRGQKAFELIQELMSDENSYRTQDSETGRYRYLTWSEMSDEEKVRKVNGCYSDAADYAKAKYFVEQYEQKIKDGDDSEKTKKAFEGYQKIIDKFEEE